MASVTGLEWVQGSEEAVAGDCAVDVHAWEEAALDHPERFMRDLEAMGLPPEDVGLAAGVRDAAQADVEAAVQGFWDTHPVEYAVTPPEVQAEVQEIWESARRSAFERLGDWFARRKVVVEDRQLVDLKLPLFVISAPDTFDSTAVFKAGTGGERKVGWSVSLAGTGLGSDAVVSTSVSSAFKADAGQTKVVFLPVTVAVERLLVTERGVQATRLDVTSVADRQRVPGVLLLAPDAVPALGGFEQMYPLAGDPTGATATYEYTYEQTRAPSLSVGVKAFGADLGVKSEAKLAASVELTFGLRSGADYRLHRLAEGDGLLWAS